MTDSNPSPNQFPVELPNLKGVATNDLVESIGTGKYSATYINWSRTMQLLRDHAPGWMPELVPSTRNGGVLWESPVGCYLMLRFQHISGYVTPMVPQAIMDYKNNSIPLAKITSRDITDTERRGSCLLASKQFGLAYELWAKMPLENPYRVVDDLPKEASSSSAKLPMKKPEKPKASPVLKSEPLIPDDGSELRETFMNALRGIGLMEELIESFTDKARDGKGYQEGMSSIYSFPQGWAEEQNKKFREKQEASAY
jgi:hypothetical protein